MESHHDSTGVDGDSSPTYSSHTTIVPTSTPSQSLQVDSASQRWGFGREPVKDPTRRYSHFSKRESVVIRDSVAYPSESSFEATIKEGTANLGRRASTKPRLVDLDRLRRKMRKIRRGGSRRGSTTETASTASTAGVSEAGQPEQVMLSPITSRQIVTEMYHETQNDIMLQTRPRSSPPREPPRPFRDRIRGRDYSRTAGNLESGIPDYARRDGRDGSKHSLCPPQCVIL
ncbi:hypothetical protein F5Y13DRAFT_189936 [Hypoxylon sp. FL1857]|nr:hypothetical protein F5Y13DRAFT_189936 [Hypoxylon sp. FL1857]